MVSCHMHIAHTLIDEFGYPKPIFDTVQWMHLGKYPKPDIFGARTQEMVPELDSNPTFAIPSLRELVLNSLNCEISISNLFTSSIMSR